MYVWNIEPSYVVDQESIFGNTPVFCQTCTSRPQAYAQEQIGGHEAVVGRLRRVRQLEEVRPGVA